MASAFDLTTSIVASSFRAWRGTASFRSAAEQPEKLIELYEFEACPYCRLVREALTELDLDALIYPCPQGGTRFRPKAVELGGRSQFPVLVDGNTGETLIESADIIDYLHSQYGRGDKAARGLRRSLQVSGSYLATASRSLGSARGMRARASREPEQALELYSFESSPYSRPVRERLCELELPYVLRNFAKARWEDMGPPFVRSKFFPDTPLEGRNRIRMKQMTGRLQVPYLIDPNTDTAMYESSDILEYLERTYAVS